MNSDHARYRALTLNLTVGYGTALWLALVDRGVLLAQSELVAVALSVFAVGSLALPGLLMVTQLVDRLRQGVDDGALRVALTSLAGAAMASGLHVAHGIVTGQVPTAVALPALAGLELLVALCATLPLAVAAHIVAKRSVAKHSVAKHSPTPARDSGSGGRDRTPGRSRVARRSATLTAVGLSMVVAVTATPVYAAPVASAATAAPVGTGVCVNATRTITYDVEALSVDLPLNGWGDHIPDGMVYALANDDAFVSATDIREEPGRATPLVLRAAVGDCIKVTLKNSISGTRVGMHVDGISKEVTGPQASDGADIGLNDDSTVATGASRTYTWYAGRAGQFAINDYGSGTNYGAGDPKQDTTSRGLYGALVVVAKGSTWHDPVTGANLLSADGRGLGAPVFADVRGPASGDDYRDVALLFLDEPEDVLDKDGRAPVFPHTGLVDASFGFNYRTEPLRNRLQAVLDHRDGKTVTLPNGTVILPEDHFCDGWTVDQTDEENLARLAKDKGTSGCHGEESHLQSWPFGDPGKLTKPINEVDVLEVSAGGGTFTLTLHDPTVTRPLGDDGESLEQGLRRSWASATPPSPSRSMRARSRSRLRCSTSRCCRWLTSPPGTSPWRLSSRVSSRLPSVSTSPGATWPSRSTARTWRASRSRSRRPSQPPRRRTSRTPPRGDPAADRGAQRCADPARLPW